jgi:hypothetical protein
MITEAKKRYDKKCKLFCLRFRNEKDEKYIRFLEECPNRSEFIRKAIDRELME